MKLLVELLHFDLAVGGGSQSNTPIRVKMIHMEEGQKAMKRCIDGSCDGIVPEGTEWIEIDHLVFEGHAPVGFLESQELIQVQSCKACTLDAAQISTASFDPKNFPDFTVDRIHLINF